MLKTLKTNPDAQTISYMAVWVNRDTNGFYAPYPGHASVPDFLNFYNDPLTLFQNEVPKLYDVQ